MLRETRRKLHKRDKKIRSSKDVREKMFQIATIAN